MTGDSTGMTLGLALADPQVARRYDWSTVARAVLEVYAAVAAPALGPVSVDPRAAEPADDQAGYQPGYQERALRRFLRLRG